jgi:hypothetical protein
MSRLRLSVAGIALLLALPSGGSALAAAGGGGPIAVGPGPVSRAVSRGPRRLRLRISPNRVGASNTFSVELTRAGAHLRGARVTMSLAMTGMAMAPQVVRLRELRPGVYAITGRSFAMAGPWGLVFVVTPRSGGRSTLAVRDSP